MIAQSSPESIAPRCGILLGEHTEQDSDAVFVSKKHVDQLIKGEEVKTSIDPR